MGIQGKNIVVCCDGTGNEIKRGAQSNVLELYQRLEKSERQIVFYDPGLGTVAAPGVQTRTAKCITKALGLAFAYGWASNVKDAYRFLMHTYEKGDRIFLFGFSRGAYTVRALAGLIRMCGLLQRNCENLIDYALQVHRSREKGQPAFKKAARFRKYFPRQWPDENGDGCIHFIGVWDTVKSIGLFRRSLVLPYTANMDVATHGRHAVSLNEKRSRYRPNLWKPKHAGDIDPATGLPRFVQAWFPGAHSDVGGGYEEFGLSDVALEWMLGEAYAHGLLLDEFSGARPLEPDPGGRMHNSLLPFWWLLGWKKRCVPLEGSVAHASVKTRCEKDPGFAAFCGKVLPEGIAYVSSLQWP